MKLKSWANGATEHRRVFVLEQALAYLNEYKLRESDCIGLCTDEDGNLLIDHNTEEV